MLINYCVALDRPHKPWEHNLAQNLVPISFRSVPNDFRLWRAAVVEELPAAAAQVAKARW